MTDPIRCTGTKAARPSGHERMGGTFHTLLALQTLDGAIERLVVRILLRSVA